MNPETPRTRRIAMLTSGVGLALAVAADLRTRVEKDEITVIVDGRSEDQRLSAIPEFKVRQSDLDTAEWNERLSKLTPAQSHVYSALRHSGQTREVAYPHAASMDPEMTIEDLQRVAKENVMERSPAYVRAEEKRARKAAKLASRA